MPSGMRTAPDTDAKIAEVFREHPKWKAPRIRNEVNLLLQHKNPGIPNNVPGISYVRQKLTKIRKVIKSATVNEQDRLWSLGALEYYPISPVALPEVVKIWKLHHHSITIRKAKWIARLVPLITNVLELDEAADNYAREEQIYESLDRHFDSKVMDEDILDPELTMADTQTLGI